MLYEAQDLLQFCESDRARSCVWRREREKLKEGFSSQCIGSNDSKEHYRVPAEWQQFTSCDISNHFSSTFSCTVCSHTYNNTTSHSGAMLVWGANVVHIRVLHSEINLKLKLNSWIWTEWTNMMQNSKLNSNSVRDQNENKLKFKEIYITAIL